MVCNRLFKDWTEDVICPAPERKFLGLHGGSGPLPGYQPVCNGLASSTCLHYAEIDCFSRLQTCENCAPTQQAISLFTADVDYATADVGQKMKIWITGH